MHNLSTAVVAENLQEIMPAESQLGHFLLVNTRIERIHLTLNLHGVVSILNTGKDLEGGLAG